jgi:hypothetical protein
VIKPGAPKMIDAEAMMPGNLNLRPSVLEIVSNIASISRPIVAVDAYSWYEVAFFWKRRLPECFLENEAKRKGHKDDLWRRTIFSASQLK